MPPSISVTAVADAAYRVTVQEGATRTTHDVAVTPDDVARYAPGVSAERLLEASFKFLLAREPKESILSRFTLPTIERYFPEYPSKIRELI